jgi:uncharacterized protein
VILLDANLPLYAYDSSSDHHQAARRWFEQALAGPEQVGFPWITVLAFLRIATNHRVFARPLTVTDAVAIVQEWLSLPFSCIVEPTEHHLGLLGSLAARGQARGPLLTDAHLATLAIEHGATLCSADRDFTRFPDLQLLNPLT